MRRVGVSEENQLQELFMCRFHPPRQSSRLLDEAGLEADGNTVDFAGDPIVTISYQTGVFTPRCNRSFTEQVLEKSLLRWVSLGEKQCDLELHPPVGTTPRFGGISEDLQLGVNVLIAQLEDPADTAAQENRSAIAGAGWCSRMRRG